MGTLKEELEKVLEHNKAQITEEKSEITDVLVMGPTGCGKTSMIEEWLDSHPEVNTWNWFANCYPHVIRKIYDADMNLISCSPCLFDSATIEKIDDPNCILVIDHFDLTDNEARTQMLDLIKHRKVHLFTGKEQTLSKGPLMIVAVAFDRAEFGYKDLSEEEKATFEKVINISY